ncbi:hypothetical protein FKW77_005459 [Venturia effusa]|uniref:Glycosyltransferase 2-like domain-containing protein n=1 Tax=Venturia effusa TaxID=50376 RepID=A0A517KWE1_9PEZI|nr:hypothetical protein FKW77_005459 [Venturia effusa]
MSYQPCSSRPMTGNAFSNESVDDIHQNPFNSPYTSYHAGQSQRSISPESTLDKDGSDTLRDDSDTMSRRESYNASYPQTPSYARAPPGLGRAQGHRTLSDLYDESPPATPIGRDLSATPMGRRPWLSGSRPESEATLMGISGSQSPTPYQNSPYHSTDAFKSLIPNMSSIELNEKSGLRDMHVVELNRKDDHAHMPAWKLFLFKTSPILCILTLIAYWTYFTLRIIFVLSSQRKTGKTFPMAWVFIGTEVAVAIPLLIQTLWNVFILKSRNRPQLRLVGEDVPSVDVFITCCKEEVDLIVDTARAACEIDYPRERYRVVVLDDGGDQDLESAITNLAQTCNYQNLHYRARKKVPGVPHHFKAGNLNYGFEEVCHMYGGASSYIAALDADMIPERHWLRALLPHLVNDPKMAMACPPQLFYNIPRGDPLAQSLDFFVHICEPIKDALGVAWCTGSGYVFRREAVEDIGMIPLGSLAEDVATSTLMLGKGWKTAYVHEPLQFGTVPDSFASHLKQRTRWAIGTVDTSFKLNFCLWGKNISGMRFMPRVSGFLFAILSLYNIPLMVSLFALPIVLMSGKPLIAYADFGQLLWLVRACFAAVMINRICELALYLPAGYATGQRGARSQLWMSPYISLSVVRSFFLPKWLGGKVQNFKPTGSLKDELNERDPSTRAHLFRRIKAVLLNYNGFFHVIYVYFCLSAISLSSSRCIAQNDNAHDKVLCLLTHAFWPPLSWLIIVSAFWVPLTYAIDPPDMPTREELLIVDAKNGVRRPTEKAKMIGWGYRDAKFEFLYDLTTLFTTVCFVASFFVTS